MLCWLAGWLGLATNKWVQSATREAASEARVRWRWFGVGRFGVGGVGSIVAIGWVGWGGCSHAPLGRGMAESVGSGVSESFSEFPPTSGFFFHHWLKGTWKES